MIESLISAGFGGQGVLLIGRVLSHAAIKEELNVTWIPSYGPEMRGGTANCTVVISDKEIGSPIIHNPKTVIVMNLPSFKKFEPRVKEVLIVNASLVNEKTSRSIKEFRIPMNKIAQDLGNEIVANMVALGAYIEIKKIVKVESVFNALKEVLPEKRHHLIPLNENAIIKGINFVKNEL